MMLRHRHLACRRKQGYRQQDSGKGELACQEQIQMIAQTREREEQGKKHLREPVSRTVSITNAVEVQHQCTKLDL